MTEESKELVPTDAVEQLSKSDEIGYKNERRVAIDILVAHTGMRQGEAGMVWARIEHSFDCICQEIGADGQAVVKGMAVGIRAFIRGRP